jgi:3-oxoadipate CoA-transferase, alpha subunit
VNRRVETYSSAVEGLQDGCTVLIGGFGSSGVPLGLIAAICAKNLRNLTLVTNNAGTTDHDIARLFKEERVRKLICSFPRAAGNEAFAAQYFSGRVSLELVPQGTLAERIRCGGAGLGGFFTPVAAGTTLSRGKETRMIGGREHVFEHPIRGDATLIRAHIADELGNLRYRGLARNFAPLMATAADLVVVETDRMVGRGELAPEDINTPCIFVDRVIVKGSPS